LTKHLICRIITTNKVANKRSIDNLVKTYLMMINQTVAYLNFQKPYMMDMMAMGMCGQIQLAVPKDKV